MGNAMAARWFRVWYRPYGTIGLWTYGWLFPSDSLIHANETLDRTCRVKDKTRSTYRVEQVDPEDFDHPQEGTGRARIRRRARDAPNTR